MCAPFSWGSGQRLILAAGALVLCFGSGWAARAQPRAQEAPADEDYTLRVDVELVTLNVTVLDRNGRIFPGLEEEDFAVYEDGVRQAIEFFGHDDVPASIGIVLDNSRSIEANRQYVVNAALQFLSLMGPEDEAFVIHFSDEVLPVETGPETFTSDRETLGRAVARLRPIGITRLYDAVDLGLEYLDRGRWPRKALLVLSDGGDNGSSIEEEALRKRIEASEAPIFPIGIIDLRWGEVDPRVLRRFADQSGGLAFFPEEPIELPSIWGRISQLIHQQYTIGYVPKESRSGYHAIQVDVPDRNVEVHARRGYTVAVPED